MIMTAMNSQEDKSNICFKCHRKIPKQVTLKNDDNIHTTTPTTQEIDELPKYHIEFDKWDPISYYDDTHTLGSHCIKSMKESYSSDTMNPFYLILLMFKIITKKTMRIKMTVVHHCQFLIQYMK